MLWKGSEGAGVDPGLSKDSFEKDKHMVYKHW